MRECAKYFLTTSFACRLLLENASVPSSILEPCLRQWYHPKNADPQWDSYSKSQPMFHFYWGFGVDLCRWVNPPPHTPVYRKLNYLSPIGARYQRHRLHAWASGGVQGGVNTSMNIQQQQLKEIPSPSTEQSRASKSLKVYIF